MSNPALALDPEPVTPVGLLAAVRGSTRTMLEAELARVHHILEWCAAHEVGHEHDAATLEGFGSQGLLIAGDGAPYVDEFALGELTAALGMSPTAGRAHVGKILEIRYRLPLIWKRVARGEVALWRAGMVAERTIGLGEDAAGYVDQHLAAFIHRVGPAQVERLCEEAITRFDPETAEQRRRDAADGRRFDIHPGSLGPDGVVDVSGTLDAADAADLEHAVRAGAQELKDLGSEESLDVRRAQAVGEMARAQTAFDLNQTGDTNDSGAPESDPDHATGVHDAPAKGRGRAGRRGAPITSPRQLVLHVHLHQDALSASNGEACLARVESTPGLGRGGFVLAEQVRAWTGVDTDTHITVKPVVDLNAHVRVDAYEVPDRIRTQVAERDGHCVHPYCTRPAIPPHPGRQCRWDADHVIAHADDGPTCMCNLAPLCRQHHRAKTHGGWRYRVLDPGTYIWYSRHGQIFYVDGHGTLDLTPTPNGRQVVPYPCAAAAPD